MIEIADNALQLAVCVILLVLSGIRGTATRRREYVLCACIYLCYALGLAYWLIYRVVMDVTPQIFYVSDLSWIAAFLFMFLLVLYVAEPAERRFHTPWGIPPGLLGVGLILFLCQWGDVLSNIVWGGLTTVVSSVAVRGIVWSRRQLSGAAKTCSPEASGGLAASGSTAGNRTPAHYRALLRLNWNVLALILAEYAVWVISCWWLGDTLKNPYFWADGVLTLSLIFLLSSVGKVVKTSCI